MDQRAHGTLDFHAQQSALPDIDEKIGHVFRVQVLAETALLLCAGQSLAELVAIAVHCLAQGGLTEFARVADLAQ